MRLTTLFIAYIKQILRKRRFLLTLFILLCVWTYVDTNLIIDWSDVHNWNFKKRTILIDFDTFSHFEKFPELDCGSFLTEGAGAFEDYKESGRIIVEDEFDMPMDCNSIQRRLSGNLKYPEVENTYAISRVVYKDYFWQESVLSQTYSPQNLYCYSIDIKSSEKFVRSMEKLAKCLPNVIISDMRYDYDSGGHFVNFGHFACSEKLIKAYDWKYVLWIQNHDLILRTNQEMSNIMGFLNGSHGIGHKPAQWKRYAVTKDWSAEALTLWKNPERRSVKQREAILNIAQNYNEVFISRELMEFVLKEVNYANLLEAFEVPYRFATDELFWATLIASEDLELPGAPRTPCPDNRFYITRYNEWEKWYNPPCKSGFSRHGTCIFGMEYLPQFSRLYQICANKILPDFDYGFIKCYGELLHRRTFGGEPSPDSMSVYSGDSRDNC